MVQRDVENDAHAPLVRGFSERLEVLQRAVIRVDCLEVGHVVAVIARRGENRHQPQNADFQVIICLGATVIEVVQFLANALQVADLVAVRGRIRPRADEDVIDKVVLALSLGPCNPALACDQQHNKLATIPSHRELVFHTIEFLLKSYLRQWCGG